MAKPKKPGTGMYANGKRGVVNHGESVRPIVSSVKNPSPHYGLQPLYYDESRKYYASLEMGTIVAIDPESGLLVPANGGSTVTVTYTQADVTAQVLNDNGDIVSVGETKTFAANKPLGWLFEDLFQNPACWDGWATDLITLNPTFNRAGLVITGTTYKTPGSKYDLKPGDYIKADNPSAADLLENPNARVGRYCKWIEGTDSLSQRAGMVMNVEVVGSTFDTQSLELVDTKGYDVQGGENTLGLPRHLFNSFGGDSSIIKENEENGYINTVLFIDINKIS